MVPRGDHAPSDSPIDVIRVLVIDENATLRKSLRSLFGLEPDLELAGEAADGPAGVEQAYALRPHLVLLDVDLPITSGLVAAAQIKERLPDTKIVFFAADPSAESQALATAGDAFIAKSAPIATVVDTLRRLASGRPPLLKPSQMRDLLNGGAASEDVSASSEPEHADKSITSDLPAETQDVDASLTDEKSPVQPTEVQPTETADADASLTDEKLPAQPTEVQPTEVQPTETVLAPAQRTEAQPTEADVALAPSSAADALEPDPSEPLELPRKHVATPAANGVEEAHLVAAPFTSLSTLCAFIEQLAAIDQITSLRPGRIEDGRLEAILHYRTDKPLEDSLQALQGFAPTVHREGERTIHVTLGTSET
ncbi:MAG: response regulator [Chloroflexi bacterium]|nr:response regulator [Chloroflexota bacterium]